MDTNNQYQSVNPLSQRFRNQAEAQSEAKADWRNADTSTKASPLYATARQNEVLKRFKIILRTGKSFSIPYAFLPIMELVSLSELRIHTPDLRIIIKGRDLYKLEEYLTLDLLKWLKESPSGRDDTELDIFISEISLECDYIL